MIHCYDHKIHFCRMVTRIVRKDYSITKTKFNYEKIIFCDLIHVFLQHNKDNVKDVFIIIW